MGPFCVTCSWRKVARKFGASFRLLGQYVAIVSIGI
jgi:hypothetical protein